MIIEQIKKLDPLSKKWIGCKEIEIQEIENEIEFKLPNLYRIYLSEMGKYAGNFMRGSSAFYSDLPDLRDATVELFQENKFDYLLPENAFVFWMHQGYQTAFFLLDDKIVEDPEVFYFGEGEELKELKKINSFSDFLQIQSQMSGFENNNL